MDCARLMEQTLRKEKAYMPEKQRRSKSNSRPLGDGKTPDIFEEWVSFDSEVEMFWSQVRPRLAQIECKSFPRRAVVHGMITEETDIRSCFFSSIAQPVTFAVRDGLQEQLILCSAPSVGASNSDVGGFITVHSPSLEVEDLHSSDAEGSSGDNSDGEDCSHDFELKEQVIPVEVKIHWQVYLCRNTNVVQMMASKQRTTVRNALSQIYLYMVLEESQYGILTTKDRTVFMRQRLDGTLKRLEASRTICYDDPIGVRKYFLFMLMKAKEADVCPRSQTWTTQEGEKWIPPKRGKRQSPFTREKMQEGAKKRKQDRSSRGTRRGGASGGTTRREIFLDENIVRLIDEDVVENVNSEGNIPQEEEWLVWAKSLKQLELGDLHLQCIVKKSKSCNVWKGEVLGVEVAIKVYDFCENLDELPTFYKEVCMYQKLGSLQGSIIPHLIDCGLVWEGFLGFLAISWVGPEVVAEKLSKKEKGRLLSGLARLHGLGIVHGDLCYSNLLHAKRRGSFVFIDFENSKVADSREEMEEELQEFRALLGLNAWFVQ